MKRKVITLLGLSIIALALILAACQPAAAPTSVSPGSSKAQLPSAVTMASGQQGSGSYAYAVALSDVLQKHTGISFSVSPHRV